MPPRLQVISGRTCIAALRRFGYEVTRQRGSHVRLVCEGRASLTVPLHSELDRGTLQSILRSAEVSHEEFARVCAEL
jgi:predicted RNA binding protein YcfA (HicA-like mRNA interferase family)